MKSNFNLAIILLSSLMHQACKGLLPGVHLDHLHPIHDLIHQPNALVCLPCSSDPQLAELFANPS